MPSLEDRLQAALGDSYRVERELGGGGMSRVFVAQEVRLGRQVVVKVLPPELAAGVSAERFEREIRLAAALQHPHIVPLLTAGSQGDLLYYVMPHIAGESLRARIMHERELPVGDTVRILRDVCDALAYAHAHGIVHRDVKPDNVLLSGKHALVTDFGVAKAVSSSSGAATLTSLGMALATPDPVTQHRASVPPALAALIMRCLAKHPADRPPNADELLGRLEAMATPTGGITPQQAEISSGTAAAIRRAHPVRVATLFGFAALGVLTLAYLLVHLLGLPDWAFAGAVGLAAAGLPIILWTGVIERRRALANSTGRAAVPAGVQRWFTWRRALLGGAAGFGLLGLGTGVYMAMRLLGIGPVGTLVASGVLAQKDRLVLADFENRTADSTLGPSLTEALRVDLAQSGANRGVAPHHPQQRPARASDHALARGAAQVLAGRAGERRGRSGPRRGAPRRSDRVGHDVRHGVPQARRGAQQLGRPPVAHRRGRHAGISPPRPAHPVRARPGRGLLLLAGRVRSGQDRSGLSSGARSAAGERRGREQPGAPAQWAETIRRGGIAHDARPDRRTHAVGAVPQRDTGAGRPGQVPRRGAASGAVGLAAIDLVRGKLALAEAQLRRGMAVHEQRGIPGKYIEDAITIAIMNVHYRNAPD